MNRREIWAGLALAVAGLAAGTARAQETLHTPVLMGVEGSLVTNQYLDDRVGHRPLASEDRSLKKGSELRQGGAVTTVRPAASSEPSSARVRAQRLLDEDRARIKREEAIDD